METEEKTEVAIMLMLEQMRRLGKNYQTHGLTLDIV